MHEFNYAIVLRTLLYQRYQQKENTTQRRHKKQKDVTKKQKQSQRLFEEPIKTVDFVLKKVEGHSFAKIQYFIQV
jgi:hypothetical protein